jgi:hypothetical protein
VFAEASRLRRRPKAAASDFPKPVRRGVLQHNLHQPAEVSVSFHSGHVDRRAPGLNGEGCKGGRGEVLSVEIWLFRKRGTPEGWTATEFVKRVRCRVTILRDKDGGNCVAEIVGKPLSYSRG